MAMLPHSSAYERSRISAAIPKRQFASYERVCPAGTNGSHTVLAASPDAPTPVPRGRLSSQGSVCPVGTRDERVPCGHHGTAVNESEVASLTSTGHGSAMCDDQAGRAEGRRVAASDPKMGSLTSAYVASWFPHQAAFLLAHAPTPVPRGRLGGGRSPIAPPV